MKKITATLLLLLFVHVTQAQHYNFDFNNTGQRVCLVEAQVNLAAPSVTIRFLDAASNTGSTTTVYRRPLYTSGAEWTTVATNLPAGTTQWTDTDVAPGEIWEYKVKRMVTWLYSSMYYDATGYTVGSLLKDNSGYQGQMILLVASDVVSDLPAKYTRLKKELTGDGWYVNELIVPRAHGWDSGDTVVGIRSQVSAIYNNAPAGDKPKMLFILGHVPMPRSGSSDVTAPDAHDQNKGARGCDGYYADIDGVFTDVSTYNPGGLATPLAINLPGDYKWDQDFFPSFLEMAFGRVDFADLTNPLSEMELIGRYLDRLSSYRMAETDMGDKTGFYLGYDNSNDGSYRTLPNISGAANMYQNTAGAPHPQWVQNNGPFKVYMQNANFPELSEWQTYGMNATVYSSDQSYWGFNDEPQSFYYSRIRALLAENTRCLVMLWTTTAVNFFHQACSGDALGFALKEIMDHNPANGKMEKPPQNWDNADWWNRTHFACNGDPTLRLYQLKPPAAPAINNVNNQAVLSWGASPDSETTGYHVYRSSSELGIYERITTSPVTSLSYVLSDYQNSYWYMIRAVKPETSGCGTFLHPSAGIFVKGNLSLSVAENEMTEGLKVFPNPAKAALHIVSEKVLSALDVYSYDGRLILSDSKVSGHAVTLDVSGWKAGIYLLKATSGASEEIRRVVID